MVDLQRILEERFASIRDQRSSSLFFVEHGLSEPERDDLLVSVRMAVRSHPIDNGWWSQHPLPLIVAATEIGYKYLGPGNDFWPLLQEELGIEFAGNSRLRLRDLFSDAAKTYRGATPALGPWSSAFHIIAWPITHALLPVEFHRQLASTLASIDLRVADLSDEALYGVIRTTAGRTTVRFETFLQDKALVVAITRGLLQERVSDFSSEIIARINADLALDRVARRDIGLARGIQRSASAPMRRASTSTDQGDLIGRLQLVRREKTLTLEAVLPPIDGELLEQMRRVLRRQRYAPSLWGITDRVPGEQLLSGLPFAIRFSVLPSPDAPLLPDLAKFEFSDEVRRVMARYALSLSETSIFAVDDEGQVARQVFGPDISGYRRYWVLHEERWDSPFAKFPRVGVVGPLACTELDPSVELAATALRQFRLHVRFGTSLSIAGDAPFDVGATVPEFAVGDVRFAVPTRLPPAGTVVRLAGREVELNDEIVMFNIEEGDHSLEVRGESSFRAYPFRGVDPTKRVAVPLCWIDVLAPEMTVQALIGGAFAIRVDSLSPLEGLELRVELETTGHLVGVTVPLGTLPQVLGADEEPWPTLLDEQTRSVVLRCPNPKLHVRVGSIAEAVFHLEQRVRPCWWRPKGDIYVLESELGEIGYGVVDAVSPVSMPVAGMGDEKGVRLFSPLDVDTFILGPIAEFTGLCLAPKSISLGLQQIPKPQLQRQRHGAAGRVGLEDLTLAYLRWALADSDGFTAELRRKQVWSTVDNWMADLCCGSDWALRELGADVESADRWRLLLSGCLRTGLGRDPYVALSKEEAETISRLCVTEIRRALPDLWIRLDELSALDYEVLDLACGRAYETLASRYAARGDHHRATTVAEGDPGTVGEVWQSALQGIRGKSNLRALGELLLPTLHANNLIGIDYSLMSLSDIKDELLSWARDAKRALAGPIPSDDILEAIVALWVAPANAVKMNWRGALDVLLAERCVARASRYVAVRWRHARQGGFA